jgi:hypothetical protein
MKSQRLEECGSFFPTLFGSTHLAAMTFCKELQWIGGTADGTCLEDRNSF